MSNSQSTRIDETKLNTIQERVLKAEKKQLHMQKPHNIIPEIKGIIEEEIQSVDEDEG